MRCVFKYETNVHSLLRVIMSRDHETAVSCRRPVAGSGTMTRVEREDSEEPNVYTLRLAPREHVTFDETAVDNEFFGRRKSKSTYVRGEDTDITLTIHRMMMMMI